MHIKSQLLVAAAILSGCTSYPAVKPRFMWAGTYTVETIERVPDKNALTGYFTRVTGEKLETSTDIIEARQGQFFGITYDFDGAPLNSPVRHTVRWTFPSPGMTNPETKESRASSELTTICYIGTGCTRWWQFTETWEIVPGEWRVEVLIGSQPWLTHSFQVRARRN